MRCWQVTAECGDGLERPLRGEVAAFQIERQIRVLRFRQRWNPEDGIKHLVAKGRQTEHCRASARVINRNCAGSGVKSGDSELRRVGPVSRHILELVASASDFEPVSAGSDWSGRTGRNALDQIRRKARQPAPARPPSKVIAISPDQVTS